MRQMGEIRIQPPPPLYHPLSLLDSTGPHYRYHHDAMNIILITV